MALLQRIIGHTDYAFTVHEVPPDTVVPRGDFHLKSLKTDHRVASIGWALVEDDRPGRFDVDAARALGVAPGPDSGKLQRGETVSGADGPVTPEMVLGPGRAGRKVVVTGDTRPCPAVLEAAQGADVLVHDSTFTLEAADRAVETYHSTSTEAAELAKAAGVHLLALTHISFRHSPREVLAEARAVTPNVVLPHDLDRIEVPFGERGRPVFIDARAERAARRHEAQTS
jgi:ribonuclease Z